MSDQILVVTGDESSSIHGIASYNYSGGTLTRINSLSIGGSGWNAGPCAFSADGKIVWFTVTEQLPNKTYIARVDVDDDGVLANFERQSKTQDFEDASSQIAIIGERLLLADGGETNVDLWDISGATAALLDSLSLAAGTNYRDVAISADGSTACVAIGDSTLALLDLTGDTITESDSAAVTASSSVTYLAGSRWIAGRAGLSGQASLVDTDGGSITIVDMAPADGGNDGGSGDLRAVSENQIVSPGGVHSATDVITYDLVHDWGPSREAAVADNGLWAATTAANSSSGILDLWSAVDWSTKADGVVDAVGGGTRGATFRPTTGPITPEELFQASYADASAAPPKITALISPADVQRSIDTDVSNLVGGPDFYTVEAIFGIGELSDVRQDKLYFVKDDQPGLRDGKLLRLKRYQIRNGDPAVPVTCTFWG